MADLFDAVRTLQRACMQFDAINWGGCGVWAGIVADELNKRGVDATVVILTFPDYRERMKVGVSLNDIESTVPPVSYDWEVNGVMFTHLMVSLNINGESFYFDSEQIVPAGNIKLNNSDLVPYPGHISAKTTKKLCSRKQGWNTTFDRRQTPLMRRVIKEEIKKQLAVA